MKSHRLSFNALVCWAGERIEFRHMHSAGLRPDTLDKRYLTRDNLRYHRNTIQPLSTLTRLKPPAFALRSTQWRPIPLSDQLPGLYIFQSMRYRRCGSSFAGPAVAVCCCSGCMGILIVINEISRAIELTTIRVCAFGGDNVQFAQRRSVRLWFSTLSARCSSQCSGYLFCNRAAESVGLCVCYMSIYLSLMGSVNFVR